MKRKNLKYSLAFFAVFLVFAAAALAPHDALAAKHRHHHVVKHAKKKVAFKKTSKNLAAGHAAQGKPIMGVADPNVDEPSEMIMAIKNKAQDKFWDGKRPYKEQLQQRNLVRTPVAAAPVPVATTPPIAPQMPVGTATNDTLRRVAYSDLTGVTFDDQPLRMNASEAFRRSLDTVSFELGRPCKQQEYFGWPLQQSEQSRVNSIFEATNEKLKLRGFSLTPRHPRSVGSDVSVFTADRLDNKVLGIWSAGDVGLLLLMCNAETPEEIAAAHAKEKQEALKAAKAKTKHGSKRKKARKLFQPNAALTEPKAEASMPAKDAVQQVAPEFRKDDSASTPGVSAPAVAPAPDAPKPAEQKPQVIPGAPAKDAAPLVEAPKPATENPPAAFSPSAAVPAALPSAPSVPAAAAAIAPAAAPSALMRALPPQDVAPVAAAAASGAVQQGATAVKDKAIDAVKEKAADVVPAVAAPALPTAPTVTDIVKP